MAPLDAPGEQYAVTDRPAPDARRAAMADALAIFRAAGRARRMASDATADWFDPAKSNLLRRWFLYAAATREFDRETVAYFRDLLRGAVRAYRALRVPEAT